MSFESRHIFLKLKKLHEMTFRYTKKTFKEINHTLVLSQWCIWNCFVDSVKPESEKNSNFRHYICLSFHEIIIIKIQFF